METLIILSCVVVSLFNFSAIDVKCYVNDYDIVLNCQVIIVDNNALIACDTKPFFSKKQFDDFKTNLEKELLQQFGFDEVIITINLIDYHIANKIIKDGSYNNMSPKDFYILVKNKR